MQIYMKDGKALKINGGGYLSPKASGETWVLNENPDLSSRFDYTINFNSNNAEFTRMVSAGMLAPGAINHNLNYYTGPLVRANVYIGEYNRWTNEAYRTITFLEPPTGDLLTWLQANGTKQ